MASLKNVTDILWDVVFIMRRIIMLRTRKEKGFSLVELVIVVVILGIIAAIAIPRISSGSKNAGQSALKANLATLRNCIDWYYGEHNATYPGINAAGGIYGAADTPEAFSNQLTMYSNAAGAVSPDKSTDYPFGPYIRNNFPKLPVGSMAGDAAIKIVSKVGPLVSADADASTGWVFNPTTGEIVANLPDTETGSDGVSFIDY
jgi:general secretion pathway protein G